MTMDTQFDTRQGYCRKLGHYLTFKYCREENNTMPCPKIRDCWFHDMDVDLFIANNFKKEEIKYLVQPVKPKITSILDCIRQAKENQERM
jgi:hypothetical protein